ncbi:hypothetical protein [Luteolibacter luteus]|uniref:Uncharacterized protein n=1 Tax=Luteolibacter luteus TaxID=2728835 RepID=A0A858RJP0_9BACT|nr:hypothetical protein [Luteolibacter luteus]QJE96724.1 hypothetical protein HHL09_13340 [Luteolibacter luteus]
MKKLFATLSAALLALLSSSCLDHEATITINKDGSGTITEQTLFSAEASAMMEQMAGLGGEGQDPLAKMIDAEATAASAKKMGEGVEVEKAEKIDKDGRKGGRVTYKFKDINKVKFVMGGSMADAGKSMQPPGLPEEKKPEQKPITFKLEDGKLTLTNPQDKPVTADGEKLEKPEIDEQQLAMAQGMFKDMRMALKVQFPGGIQESDADHVAGNTITLAEMEFAKLVSDPAKLKKLMELDDPAAAAKAFKGVDGLKVESKETISVTLK